MIYADYVLNNVRKIGPMTSSKKEEQPVALVTGAGGGSIISISSLGAILPKILPHLEKIGERNRLRFIKKEQLVESEE